jgi:predicted phage terminase large subunit-like protein
MNFNYRDFLNVCSAFLAPFIEFAFSVVNPGKDFVPAWHLDAMAHALERCARGECQRLIITVPPRYGKSLAASVAFPAWLLGFDPTLRIVCISYSAELAELHARDCKALMESTTYKEMFPGTRIDVRHGGEMDFQTTRRGRRFATSVEGTLTGRGGSFIILDDPMKPLDALSEKRRAKIHEWFQKTLISRLDSKKDDVIIVVMQRIHIDDTVGRLIARGGFEVLNLPAIAVQDEDIPLGLGRVQHRNVGEALDEHREPLDVLAKLREEMEPTNFEAQYQQNPSASNEAVIKWNDFARYNARPRLEPEDYYVISWDTAVKTGNSNNYSVASVWLVQLSHLPPGARTLADARFYLVYVYRAKLDFPGLRDAMLDLCKTYRRTKAVLIEDTHLGPALQTELAKWSRLKVELVRPIGDKASRLWAQAGWVHRRQILLPESATWLEPFRQEFEAFPNGAYDDQVDSFSQFLTWVMGRVRKSTTFTKY